MNPEAIYIWVPGGAQPAAIGKALAERGIDPQKTKVMGQGELTEDAGAARAWATPRVGIITVYHYDHDHNSDDEQGLRESVQGSQQSQPGHLFDRRL